MVDDNWRVAPSPTGGNNGLIVLDAETFTTDDVAIAMREELEDETETFLYALYDATTPALAERFRTLIERSAHELSVLAEVARSLDIDIPADEPLSFDPDVDRIVWRQVARSSTLALFDWLGSDNRHRAGVPWVDWARGCGNGLDFKMFRAETSLQASDARLALDVTAHAIVGWTRVQRPVPLFYRGQFITLLASGESISCMRTGSRPLAWFDLAGKEEPAVDEDEETVHVHMPTEVDLELVTLAPWVNFTEAGHRLIFSPTVQHGAGEATAASVALGIDERCRALKTPEGIRVVCEVPGALNFSAPRRALSRYGQGFLLEWNTSEDIL